ncbi:hypothetical protein [Xanthobacter autotrophicus]|uniref:hypothetical protein n=1 Tax=Xanthobacter autotrophicus TaxID=280 RepID=UPI0024A6723E|nr:hypothetical protein [Xanthobacter autotrophicus]MDI4656930.1 hypothetical protein [Xanthobacter autotrophicus]
MSVMRVLVPAILGLVLLVALIARPSETVVVLGSAVLTLTTASSIVFFGFVAVAALIGLERHSGRHLAPAAPVHVHRSLRDEV